MQHLAGDGDTQRASGGDRDGYVNDEGRFAGVAAERHREVATNQADLAIRLWIGIHIGATSDRKFLSIVCKAAGPLGASAGDDAATVCRIDDDLVRWREFGRRRQWRNRHRSRNVHDHGIRECDDGFDYPHPQHEADPDRAIAALAGLISLPGYCVNQFIDIALVNCIVLLGRELRTKSRARHPQDAAYRGSKRWVCCSGSCL